MGNENAIIKLCVAARRMYNDKFYFPKISLTGVFNSDVVG